MEAWELEMVKMFNDSKNKPIAAGFIVGKVIKPLPNITVAVGDDILLDKEDLFIANQLYFKHTHQANEYHTPVPKPLAIGDEVILIPDSSGQKYALIDKAGE
ncbi:hypothetical protein J40TS1_34010 [Paenibacillus montaniterrae]|uniref:DUF2577 domain-containing protein n=1 Tax=Paenibacillus montaniterrae TaxID=429341 RepID=A0A919YSW8_9BACL|nr:DUF2577 family protein [Paenibacillus montaniterrae]GIP17759.1 hypothetical protein J40TS1_34010 [Paenibacillus montaniterrae]